MAKLDKDLYEAGEFLREYGKQYFVVASEAFSIGRIKFSMVPIGAAGQKALEFYLPVEAFNILCEEVRNGVFAKKIAADQGQYPGAYKFVTGDDGCLHLNIGGGKVGVRIQIQNAKDKTNYQMAVSEDSIKNMAFRYMICSGLINPGPGSYYATLYKAFLDGQENRNKYHKELPKEQMEVSSGAPVEAVEKTPAKEVEEKPVEKQVEKAEDDGASVSCTLIVKGAKAENAKYFMYPAMLGEENVTVMFEKKLADTLKWFAPFEKKVASDSGATISIVGTRKKNYILFEKIQ